MLRICLEKFSPQLGANALVPTGRSNRVKRNTWNVLDFYTRRLSVPAAECAYFRVPETKGFLFPPPSLLPRCTAVPFRGQTSPICSCPPILRSVSANEQLQNVFAHLSRLTASSYTGVHNCSKLYISIYYLCIYILYRQQK